MFEDYSFNPCAKSKDLQIICNGQCVLPNGELSHRIDVEEVETGMVYTYEIAASKYAGDPYGCIRDLKTYPVSGYFKYNNEIDLNGIEKLAESGQYPKKRLAIAAIIRGHHDLAKKLYNGSDLDGLNKKDNG